MSFITKSRGKRHAPHDACISSKQQRNFRRVVVRVFLGARNSVQTTPFLEAVVSTRRIWGESFESFPAFECLCTDDVKRFHWGLKELIDWLLMADIYFIINHIHQGLWEIIDCRDISVQLNRLNGHIGFPSGIQLQCPVFQQDKYEYIDSMPQDMMIPSFKVPIVHKQGNYVVVTATIFLLDDFTEAYAHCGCGWVVKPPYCTNSEGYRSCSTREQLVEIIRTSARRFGHRFDYLIVQPCLENKKEYKVVLLGGKTQYISNHSKAGKGRSFADKKSIEEFAQRAADALKSACPASITDMLFRVDVMQLSSDKFVVNEFESFEALACGSRGNDMAVCPFLVKFWSGQIERCQERHMQINC